MRKLNTTEINFCREFGHSLANAENNFVDSIAANAGISGDDAFKVFGVYKKAKAIKFDRTNSRYVVVHGGFLDKEVILRALAAA
jgi:hypothetical protein